MEAHIHCLFCGRTLVGGKHLPGKPGGYLYYLSISVWARLTYHQGTSAFPLTTSGSSLGACRWAWQRG